MENSWIFALIVVAVFLILIASCVLAVFRVPKKTCSCHGIMPLREGFISSGSEGATMNDNAITGPRLYGNQMIQNGKHWEDIVKSVKDKNEASDGPGTLGAGKGRGFDNEMRNQQRYNDYLTKKGKLSQQEVNKVTQAINDGIANSLGEISLFNRGKQVAGNLIIQDGLNATIGMMDEDFYSERQKNRNIYTASKAVHVKGFRINPENMGNEFKDYHPSKLLSKNNKKIPYMTDGVKPNNGVKVEDGKLILENSKAKISTNIGAENKNKGVTTKQLDNGKQMVKLASA